MNLWWGELEFHWTWERKRGGTGGATAEEASALSIEILLSEVKPKLGPKVPFLVTIPGGTFDRFLQIRETFVGFLPAESIF